MGNPEKENAAQGAASAEIFRRIDIDDPPPAYTSSETPADSKAPPLPSVPPVVTAQPFPATGTRVIRSPSPPRTDDRNSQSYESCKDICCTALRWSWFTCHDCTDSCIRMCFEKKPIRN